MSDKKFSLFGKKDTGSNDSSKSVEKKNVTQRWLLVGGGAIAVTMILTSMNTKPPEEQQQGSQKPSEKFVEVTPAVTAERTWQASALKDINDLKKAAEDSKNKQTLLEKQLEEEKKKNSELKDDLDKKLSTKGKEQSTPSVPSPVSSLPKDIVPPPIPKDGTMPTKDLPASNIKTDIPVPSTPPKVDGKAEIKKEGSMATATIPKEAISGEPVTQGGVAVAEAPAIVTKKDPDKANAKATVQKNEYAGFIPPGAAIPVVLLNGLEAGTSAATQSSPQPIFLRVQDLAELPGSAKYNLEGCFILSSAFGDLSSERVYVRTAKLSCIDKNKKLIMVSEINGVLMDSDSSLGLRGEVQSRQGPKLAKAMLAGFAQGLTGAIGSAQSTVTSGINGTVSTISGEDALRQSGLSGMSNATSQLAQFYLKEAQSMFPVISVEKGRTATLMLTAGSKLEWGKYDSQFVTRVSPINSNQ